MPWMQIAQRSSSGAAAKCWLTFVISTLWELGREDQGLESGASNFFAPPDYIGSFYVAML